MISVPWNTSTAAELAVHIQQSPGVLRITGLPTVPFKDLQALFDVLNEVPELGQRANQAYTKNQVYKDSFGQGNGGPNVDHKRLLDLSPERLEAILLHDPELAILLIRDHALILQFWESLANEAAAKVVDALALAIGTDSIKEDCHFNYRMVDYQSRTLHSAPPRCGLHRDFGLFTLIFSREPGLELFDESSSEWMPVPASKEDEAILMFGWCTQIRSNRRIPAILHRVTDTGRENTEFHAVQRRLSAVFFCAPKHVDTLLDPVVLPGEPQRYLGGIKVGDLRGKMARKWRHREGTLNESDKIEEEKQILTGLVSQDDVVRTIAI
ncbi:hypothetical protein HDU85_002155 [Gaertneriomyces sp. JEL0708]|nr:hypothetical protein HDU85_002155 [Gaertneriomyces sp. JEL0708]